MLEVTSEEQKNIELNILRWIKKICNKNNIKFMLAGGTCLGAIRHKGFIPWDDDIDLLMPYEDYKRFIEITKQSNEQYKVLSPYYTKDYYYTYSKVVDTRTKLSEKGMKEIKEMGVFIDVFPLFIQPQDKEEQKRYVKKIKNMEKKYAIYAHLEKYYKREGDSTIKQLIKLIAYFPGKVCSYFKKNSKEKLLEELEKYSNSDSEYVGYTVSSYGEKEIMKKSEYSPIKTAVFEGEEYPIANEWDKYLKNLYGNYMELPPVEKRVAPHNLIIWWREK